MIVDRTAGGFSTWEIPRGPVGGAEVLEAVAADAKTTRCMELFFSPVTPVTLAGQSLSGRHIQPQATRVLDLIPPEEAILAQMHQKGRYNIGVARKAGVTVREGSKDDLGAFYALLKATGGRDGFTIAPQSHYTRFLSALEGSFILIAEHAGKPIAGLMGVIWNGTGIYYYGASSYEHRQLMAPYALQWAAMQRCKTAGCTRYDLLGISPEQAPANDPWWGITDFKRKFGGVVVSYPPEQALVLRPMAKTMFALKRRILG